MKREKSESNKSPFFPTGLIPIIFFFKSTVQFIKGPFKKAKHAK